MGTCNIPFSIYIKENSLNYAKSAAIGFFFKGLKDEFQTAVVNEPSVFEPLKFYCIPISGWPGAVCNFLVSET